MASSSTDDTTPVAKLRFLTGWRMEQVGTLQRGGLLVIDYDPDRLPDVRRNFRGAETWDIQVEVRFHPGGQSYRESVLDEVRSGTTYGASGMVVGHVPRSVTVVVPNDAARVDMWFHNFDTAQFSSHAWDSRFGDNYQFEVAS